MDSRTRFLKTLAFDQECPSPRFENDFAEETLQLWRTQGYMDQNSPEIHFNLDSWEKVGIEWRRTRGERTVVQTEADVRRLRHTYDPADPDRFPKDWPERLARWRGRDFVVSVEPWNEGFFQVIGIHDTPSLVDALTVLCERPAIIEATMEYYAGYLEFLLAHVLAEVEADCAFLYEPIASNCAPVISPAMYKRFAWPALKTVVDCLERHGVAHRFMWTAGNVVSLIPLWLEAGINGLYLSRPAEAGVSYLELRQEYGRRLRLLGGVDWRVLLRGRKAIREALQRDVVPLLEQGGYIPHLDDTVRPYIPYENFAFYRASLNALLAGSP